MSQSLFERVTKSAEGYEVGGQLGNGSAPRKRPDGQRDVRISAMVWQTAKDRNEGDGTTPVAIASGPGAQDKTDLSKWAATITMHQSAPLTPLKGDLKPGCPATGIAVSVECADDQTAFETFTWADRVQIPT
jgi:hypothetical protein